MSIRTQNQRANDAFEAMLSDDTVLSTRTSKNPYIAEFYRDYGLKAGSWNRLISPNKGDDFFFYSLDRKMNVPFEEQTITVYEIKEENGFLYSNINGEECILIPCEESWTSWRGNEHTHRYCQVVTLKGKQLDSIWLSNNWGGPEDVCVKQPYSIMDVIYHLFGKEIDNWMNCKKFRFEYYSSNSGKTTDFDTQSIRIKLNIPELILRYISTEVFNVLYKYYTYGCKFYIHGGVSPNDLIESDRQGTTRELVESLISRKKSNTSDQRLYHRLRLKVMECIRKGTYVNSEDLIKYNLVNPNITSHHYHFNWNAKGEGVILLTKEDIASFKSHFNWCEMVEATLGELVNKGVAIHPEATNTQFSSQEVYLIRINAIKNKHFSCSYKENVLKALSYLGY